MSVDLEKALARMSGTTGEWEQRPTLAFEEYMKLLAERPEKTIRNVFQLVHDMVTGYMPEGYDEYPDDPESIHYLYYDYRRLFVEDSDNPFFPDRLFSNRLVNLVSAWRRGAQQNKIYIFEGPPGSGKSTFLNNLLQKFERYANLKENCCYEVLWRISREQVASFAPQEVDQFLEKLSRLLDEYELGQRTILEARRTLFAGDYLDVPCPSHDHPLLTIPREHRRAFLDDLLPDGGMKERLFGEKQFQWVFRNNPCTICTSLYRILLDRLGDPVQVLRMVHARPYRFNRRLGEGISVYAPGDRPPYQSAIVNEMIQDRLNSLMRESNPVRYIFSRYARTNNGIYALMDIKSHNADRLVELHNIVSEGIHKVDDLEENVNSLFIGIMNPEDKRNIQIFQSFSDRIETVRISYVLDLNTEVEIYRNIFGRNLDSSFLPRVLHNFARVIISSRLNIRSPALLEWIDDPYKYHLLCDENLQLLKMELYTGHIPSWLTEEDRKRLTAKTRKAVIDESEEEGDFGFSGRDSIRVFNDFFSAYGRKGKLIDMADLHSFFTRMHPEYIELIPARFLHSLIRNYNYTVLQEVKESLYYYNEPQISRDIKNYMFAVNFEPPATVVSSLTGDRIEVTETYFQNMEAGILGKGTAPGQRVAFRRLVQKQYASVALQEILTEGKPVQETRLYHELHERYVHNLKDHALDPFLENENFRRALKDLDTPAFRTYDAKIRNDVTFLIGNLCDKFRYTRNGAKEVCTYVIDNDLARRFGNS